MVTAHRDPVGITGLADGDAEVVCVAAAGPTNRGAVGVATDCDAGGLGVAAGPSGGGGADVAADRDHRARRALVGRGLRVTLGVAVPTDHDHEDVGEIAVGDRAAATVAGERHTARAGAVGLVAGEKLGGRDPVGGVGQRRPHRRVGDAAGVGCRADQVGDRRRDVGVGCRRCRWTIPRSTPNPPTAGPTRGCWSSPRDRLSVWAAFWSLRRGITIGAAPSVVPVLDGGPVRSWIGVTDVASSDAGAASVDGGAVASGVDAVPSWPVGGVSHDRGRGGALRGRLLGGAVQALGCGSRVRTQREQAEPHQKTEERDPPQGPHRIGLGGVAHVVSDLLLSRNCRGAKGEIPPAGQELSSTAPRG